MVPGVLNKIEVIIFLGFGLDICWFRFTSFTAF